MSDVCVYYFIDADEHADGNLISTRAATLEAIKGRGEPIMDSQFVVDHTELDADGFVPEYGLSTNAADILELQIKSLKLRAESRDTEALKLNRSTDGTYKYLLYVESRELRNQAHRLETQRVDLLMSEAVVYRFSCANDEDGTAVVAPQSATLAAIAKRNGKPIEDTRRVVDPRDIDPNGFYSVGHA
jgi:hypothetical protein